MFLIFGNQLAEGRPFKYRRDLVGEWKTFHCFQETRAFCARPVATALKDRLPGVVLGVERDRAYLAPLLVQKECVRRVLRARGVVTHLNFFHFRSSPWLFFSKIRTTVYGYNKITRKSISCQRVSRKTIKNEVFVGQKGRGIQE